MSKKSRGRTSFESENVFTNAEAQDVAFALRQQGAGVLEETLQARPPRSTGGLQRVLAACEVVAAANGNAPESGRCALIEEWLFQAGYLPTAAISDLAADRLDRIMAQRDVASRLGIPADCLKSLRTRLAAPPRSVQRRPPKDDRPSFRELATWLNTSQGEVDTGPQFNRRGDARVVLVYVSVNAACKLINYRKVNELALWLNNNNDPRELASALTIMLRGWRDTLTSVEFDHVPDATITDAQRQPPYRALAACRQELADLPRLQSFATQHMFFDDDVLHAVCQNPQLKHLTIVNANITPRGFRRITRCQTLETVYASRCPGLGQADQKFVAARLPHVEFVTVGKR